MWFETVYKFEHLTDERKVIWEYTWMVITCSRSSTDFLWPFICAIFIRTALVGNPLKRHYVSPLAVQRPNPNSTASNHMWRTPSLPTYVGYLITLLCSSLFILDLRKFIFSGPHITFLCASAPMYCTPFIALRHPSFVEPQKYLKYSNIFANTHLWLCAYRIQMLVSVVDTSILIGCTQSWPRNMCL